MRLLIVLALAVSAAAGADAKALKIIEPLPRDVLGTETVTTVDVTVGEQARKTFDALEQKAADKKARAVTATPAPAGQPAAPAEDIYAALPFGEMFTRVITGEMRDWNVAGTRPVKLLLQVDTLKTADAGMAMLLGSIDELAGIVAVVDAGSGEKLGEFYVDVLNSRSGLLGLALRGSGVREKLAREFAGHVAVALTGRKSKSSMAIIEPRPAPPISTKFIVYPIEPDIMAKTPEQLGMTPSPAPTRGPDDILLVANKTADHEVTRASMMEGGARLTNPIATLLRTLAEARDRDGKLDDGQNAPGTLTITLDRGATLTRCVTTGELKGTCIIRSTMAGSAQRTGEASPRPIAITLEKTIKGVMMSHAVALVSRETALRFLAEAEGH